MSKSSIGESRQQIKLRYCICKQYWGKVSLKTARVLTDGDVVFLSTENESENPNKYMLFNVIPPFYGYQVMWAWRGIKNRTNQQGQVHRSTYLSSLKCSVAWRTCSSKAKIRKAADVMRSPFWKDTGTSEGTTGGLRVWQVQGLQELL